MAACLLDVRCNGWRDVLVDEGNASQSFSIFANFHRDPYRAVFEHAAFHIDSYVYIPYTHATSLWR